MMSQFSQWLLLLLLPGVAILQMLIPMEPDKLSRNGERRSFKFFHVFLNKKRKNLMYTLSVIKDIQPVVRNE